MSKRSAAAWSAARSVGSFVQLVTRQVETARDLHQVAVAVKSILVAFIQPHSHQAWCAVVDGELQDISRNLEQHADAVGWCALQQSFFQDQFPSWATCVLTVAGGEWLPQDQDGTLQQLIQDTFLQCPATQALEALTGHLSAVLPTHPSRHSSTVTAVAADLAAELLAQRFAAADSTGIQQLLQDTDPVWQQQQQQVAAQPPEQQQNAHASTPSSSKKQQQQAESEHSNQKQAAVAAVAAAVAGDVCSHLCDEQRQEEVAAVLASVPDRVQQLPDVPVLLQPDHFVCHVLHRAVTYVAQHVLRNDSSSSSIAATPGPIKFTALLLRKFTTRGHARSTAAAVLHLLAPAEGPVNGNSDAEDTAAADDDCVSFIKQQQQIVALQAVLLQLSDHKSAAEKLLLQLLRLATAQQHATAHPQQQQQQQLMSLLCPLLSCSSNLRGIVTRRLLTGRTLPAASLSLLLLLLQRCQPTLLPEAAVVLAQSWSEQTNILQVPVQQQAYMTAALVDCIQQLPRDLLDPLTSPVPQSSTAAAAATNASQNADTGSNPHIAAALFSLTDKGSVYQGIEPQRLSLLLPSILQGVSSRLASPSAAIRSQAMRVGRAFSVKLDPDKPLFTDAGDLLLMPEEIWPGALAKKKTNDHDHDQQRQQQQQQQRLLVVQDGSDAGVVDAAARSSSSSSSSSSKFAALNRLQEALASPEPDSDDDEEFLLKPAAAAATGVKASTATQLHTPGTNHNIATNANGVNNSVTSDDYDDQSDGLSDAGSDGSVSSLIAFDLQEDLSAESWWGPDGLGVPENSQSLSLRGLAAAVRKQDDADAVLDALARVEVLVRAEPDELSVVAPELARSLLHCKIPVWTTTESSSNNTKTSSSSSSKAHNPTPAAAIGLDPNAEVQRQRALTAVLSLSPLTVGDIVISELYSPHLDQYQRMLILDCLAAAAVEMSDYRKAPRVTAAAPGQVPKLLPSLAQQKQTAASKTASLPSSSDMTQQLTPAANSAATSSDAKPPAAAAAPGMAAVSSRVWGKVSLQKQKAAAAAGVSSSAPRTFRNRFAPIAIRWASLLLKSCDVKHHGIDLFGRDSLLLGRLLTVFGTFVEAAAATPAAVPLVAGLLELLKANEVSGHKEVFVRRSALVAASQVVRHLPPARLAGAMVGRQQDLQDQVLVERLQWLMSWAQSVAATDADEQCRMLAGGCCAWHVELAEGAMACLEQMPESEGPSLVGTRGGSRRSQKEGVQVTLPSLTDRLVLQG